MPIEDYLVMEGEDIIEAKYCMSCLVDMALGRRIETPSFDLNAEPIDSFDVDERLQLIMKLAYTQHHAQLLATFYMTTHQS
jgi:hypothetical protein